jgi:RNA polymerase sigma-70 factor (ECF subfamily)
MSEWQDVEDTQLLKYAQKGDAAAFGEIYKRNAAKVFRYLSAHTNSALDAEDLTVEVFFRVWRFLPDYRERGIPFLSFVFRVARNVLIDYYRREQREKVVLSTDDVLIADHQPGPSEVVSINHERQELLQALDALKEDHRTVLILRFISDLSPEETAQAMGRTPGAIRVMQHRALSALRKQVEQLRFSEDGRNAPKS